jgi:hypothetical protein
MCLTDCIDWRYLQSWLVFSTQLVNCCPHGRSTYTRVLLPLYLLSDLPPPRPSQSKRAVYKDSLGWGVLSCVVVHILQEFNKHSVSDKIQNLQNCFTTPNHQLRQHLGIGVFKMPSSMGEGGRMGEERKQRENLEYAKRI